MKKLIIVIALLSASMFALAEYFETPHMLTCNSAESVFNVLQTKYNEQPIWVGSINETDKAVLFVNTDGTAWTIILVNKNNACLVAHGAGFSVKPLTKRSLS